MKLSLQMDVLMSLEPVPLGLWFAEPVSQEIAHIQLKKARQHLHTTYATGGYVLPAQIAEMVALCQCGHTAGDFYRTLIATAGKDRERALVELVYGQLLMMRKLTPAFEHLQRGFMLAANLLQPEEYFIVLNRHELLRCLPLSSVPAEPRELDALLIEARIIERLEGVVPPSARANEDHLDTLD